MGRREAEISVEEYRHGTLGAGDRLKQLLAERGFALDQPVTCHPDFGAGKVRFIQEMIKPEILPPIEGEMNQAEEG